MTEKSKSRKKKDHTPYTLRFFRWFYPKLERLWPALAFRFFDRIFFTPLRYPTPPKEVKALSFARRFSMEVNGKPVAGYVWGLSDNYVLLVHGWAGRATQFRRFVKPFLAQGYQVVAFDGPAHGNSGGKRTDITEFRQVMNEIVARFGPPAGVVAHSFGGVAVLLSMVQGLPVNRLTMIASPTLGDEVIRTFLRAIRGRWEITGVAFKRLIEKKFGKPFEEYSGLWAIKNLPKPVDLLLVYDEGDLEVPMIHAQAAIREYPTAKLTITRGLGHTRILRDNGVIREIVTFISGKPS